MVRRYGLTEKASTRPTENIDGRLFGVLNDEIRDALSRNETWRARVPFVPKAGSIRLGGDEFALVLIELESIADVPPIAHRSLTALGSHDAAQRGGSDP